MYIHHHTSLSFTFVNKLSAIKNIGIHVDVDDMPICQKECKIVPLFSRWYCGYEFPNNMSWKIGKTSRYTTLYTRPHMVCVKILLISKMLYIVNCCSIFPMVGRYIVITYTNPYIWKPFMSYNVLRSPLYEQSTHTVICV